MDRREEILLWLLESPGVGPAAQRAIVARFRGAPPDDIFGRPAAWYQAALGLSRAAASALEGRRRPDGPRLHCLDGAIRVRTPYCAGYPDRLLRMKAPPPILTSYGCWPPKERQTVTVVTSRRPDPALAAGVKAAWGAAVSSGSALVAAHNRPCGQAGLLAAKRFDVPAVMVLDRGLLSAFGGDLQRDPIAVARIWGYGWKSNQTVAVSPFPPSAPFLGTSNVMRDKMLFALSDVIIAMGLREGGNMQRLCCEAVRSGRTVFADADALPLVPGAVPWRGSLPAAPGTSRTG